MAHHTMTVYRMRLPLSDELEVRAVLCSSGITADTLKQYVAEETPDGTLGGYQLYMYIVQSYVALAFHTEDRLSDDEVQRQMAMLGMVIGCEALQERVSILPEMRARVQQVGLDHRQMMTALYDVFHSMLELRPH